MKWKNTMELKYQCLLEETLEKANKIILLHDEIESLKKTNKELKKQYNKILRETEKRKK